MEPIRFALAEIQLRSRQMLVVLVPDLCIACCEMISTHFIMYSSRLNPIRPSSSMMFESRLKCPRESGVGRSDTELCDCCTRIRPYDFLAVAPGGLVGGVGA
eukprot:3179040-Rhodomonas_salina.2